MQGKIVPGNGFFTFDRLLYAAEHLEVRPFREKHRHLLTAHKGPAVLARHHGLLHHPGQYLCNILRRHTFPPAGTDRQIYLLPPVLLLIDQH